MHLVTLSPCHLFWPSGSLPLRVPACYDGKRFSKSKRGLAIMAIGPIGNYQILATLGRGAHSAILHIHRSADGRQYALKVVPLESKDDHKFLLQAQHEIKVAQMLSHPNLIKVYALETER